MNNLQKFIAKLFKIKPRYSYPDIETIKIPKNDELVVVTFKDASPEELKQFCEVFKKLLHQDKCIVTNRKPKINYVKKKDLK